MNRSTKINKKLSHLGKNISTGRPGQGLLERYT
jgi:hypothetical protein